MSIRLAPKPGRLPDTVKPFLEFRKNNGLKAWNLQSGSLLKELGWGHTYSCHLDGNMVHMESNVMKRELAGCHLEHGKKLLGRREEGCWL